MAQGPRGEAEVRGWKIGVRMPIQNVKLEFSLNSQSILHQLHMKQ